MFSFITTFLVNSALGLLRALPIHVGVYLTILDETGQQSSMTFKFPQAVDLGVVQSWINVMAQKIDAVILGQVVDGGFSLSVDLAGLGLKSAPLSGSDTADKARVIMGTSAGTTTESSIPTFDESYFDANNVADLTNVDILAIVNHIQDGQTDALINASPSNAYGDDITEVVAIAQVF